MAQQHPGTPDEPTQIWIVVSVYVLAAIVRKRLGIEASLYTLMKVFSVAAFEKEPILLLLCHKTLSS